MAVDGILRDVVRLCVVKDCNFFLVGELGRGWGQNECRCSGRRGAMGQKIVKSSNHSTPTRTPYIAWLVLGG